MRRKLPKEKVEEFFIVNEIAQVFCGLKGGLPEFTEDWKLAKPISNERQFKSVQRGTSHQLEMLPVSPKH